MYEGPMQIACHGVRAAQRVTPPNYLHKIYSTNLPQHFKYTFPTFCAQKTLSWSFPRKHATKKGQTPFKVRQSLNKQALN